MTPTMDPKLAAKAIADLRTHETLGAVVPAEKLKDFFYKNGDVELEVQLQKELYPSSYCSLHQVKDKFFIVGHIPTIDGIINIPYWDATKSVLEIASELPAE